MLLRVLWVDVKSIGMLARGDSYVCECFKRGDKRHITRLYLSEYNRLLEERNTHWCEDPDHQHRDDPIRSNVSKKLVHAVSQGMEYFRDQGSFALGRC